MAADGLGRCGARRRAACASSPGADAQAPLDPLLEEGGPPLPGTGSRAFWIGLVVVSLSLVSGLATYLILTGLTPIVPRNEVVLGVLFVNLLLVDRHGGGDRRAGGRACGAPGARRWRARACTRASSLLFSLITALPALLLAVAATTTFSRSLDNWFNRQTTSIVHELARRGARLPGGARPGHPHRHRQHGQGPRRCGGRRSATTRASSAS